jgi:phthalate 4,5-cis-dihydrodiol dehydrogenase
MTSTAEGTRTIKIGMVGIGVGGAASLLAIDAMPEIKLVAGADTSPFLRERFQLRYPQARVYGSIEELCQDPAVEAVLVSSPNGLHASHAIIAAEHGKHVMVYRPMALSLREAEQLVKAVEKNRVKLVVGHTRSYTMPIRAMRKIINSGVLGRLCAIHMWAYTDWMLTSRSAYDKDPEQGGGILLKRAPDQVDTARVLHGGKLRSVRGMTGQWMPERPMPGYYCAYLEFEDGTPCTIMHNGHGYFMGAELTPWGMSRQSSTLEQVQLRKALREGTRNEEAEEQEKRLGGRHEMREASRRGRTEFLTADGDPSMVIVTCERGDMRHSEHGIYVYDDAGLHDISISPGRDRTVEQLKELYDVVVRGKPLFHDGVWGMANLEVCLATMQSARERREILLMHQAAVRPEYAGDLEVPYLGGRQAAGASRLAQK